MKSSMLDKMLEGKARVHVGMAEEDESSQKEKKPPSDMSSMMMMLKGMDQKMGKMLKALNVDLDETEEAPEKYV